MDYLGWIKWTDEAVVFVRAGIEVVSVGVGLGDEPRHQDPKPYSVMQYSDE